MIRVSARTATLVRRLQRRAARIAASRAAARRPKRGDDWHSAPALWPDLFGDLRDGK
jgi:hypothetical protein